MESRELKLEFAEYTDKVTGRIFDAYQYCETQVEIEFFSSNFPKYFKSINPQYCSLNVLSLVSASNLNNIVLFGYWIIITVDRDFIAIHSPEEFSARFEKVEGPAFKLPSKPGFDPINHPAHYKSLGVTCGCGNSIEAIDITEKMNFNLGNAMKYLWRADYKGQALVDLKKAAWYLKREINNREQKNVR